MSAILLYNHGGCENRGCEAIVRSTAALFARTAKARVTLSSDQPVYDRAAELPNVHRVISSTISPYSVARLINSVGFRLGMPRESEIARKYGTVIHAGRESDVCLSIGGDTYCYGRQEHLLVINRRLRRVGRPLVLWGCSVEPDLLHGELLEDLRNYGLIVARESITYNAMHALGLPVWLACDPAFTMEAEELPLPSAWREGATVGLNVSPLILDHAPDRRQAIEAFVGLVRHVLASGEDAVALIPHVTWAHDSDVQALREIQAQFADEPRVFMLPETLTAPQYKGYIARLRALVTARTHASVAAYSSAVPTLVIGYSVKARGIARDLFGVEDGHLIPVQELSGAAQLIEAYDALLERASREREYLAVRLPAYIRGLDAAVEAVMALAHKG